MPLSSPSSPPAPSRTTAVTSFSDVHPDILLTHILPRLDGQTLASASLASTTINSLSTTNDELWSNLCASTWHSVSATSEIHDLISTFPSRGPRSFFSSSFPILEQAQFQSSRSRASSISEIISAVDIHYKNEAVFSKLLSTETSSSWFKCSPFRVDLLDSKELITTTIRQPENDVTCQKLSTNLTLSWILIDPKKKRTVNLSTHKPVSIQRHWLTGEIQVRYGLIVTLDRKNIVECGIVIACNGSRETGEMQISEVSLQIEDMDGMHLNGKDSLVVLEAAFEGRKGKGGKNVGHARKNYEDFLDMKREKREKRIRFENRLDSLCVGFGVTIVAVLLFFISYNTGLGNVLYSAGMRSIFLK